MNPPRSNLIYLSRMNRIEFIKGSAVLGLSLAIPNILKSNSGMLVGKGNRKIHRILNAGKTKVGTLPILRAFAGKHTDYVSPFVLFDEFGPVEVNAGTDPLKVEAHPHAGVTPTTYFMSGSGHHKDSLNYDFQIQQGEFMMFSSGRGAIHMEESGNDLTTNGGVLHGFQIWLNTPAKHKFDAPFTNVFQPDKMDFYKGTGYSARVILGELFTAKSSIELQSPAFYYHFEMEANSRVEVPTDPTHNCFLYLVEGELEVEGKRQMKPSQVAFYERGESDVQLYSECGAKFLMLGGQPLDEVVYSYGPFVMNNKEQINQCIAAYQRGEMGNPEVVNR